MGLRDRGKNAIKWSLIEKFLKRGITFVISIFLARLLEPSDFGLVAMISIFAAIAEVFYDFGLGQALVQKQNVTQLQYSTIFYINVLMGLVVYLVMWFAAPYIARFYENELLTSITRVSSLSLVLSSTNIVNAALLVKTLKYKVFAQAMLLSSVLSGGTAIVLGYLGFGVWSLVFYSLLSSLISVVSLWIMSPWTPSMKFNLKTTKEIWKTGLGFMNIGIINNVASQIDNLFIGKVFNANILGLFNRAKSLQELPQYTFILPVTQPMFPIFAQIQNEPGKLKETFFDMLHLLNFFIILFFGVMFLSAENWVVILYSDKWIESVPYLKILLFLLPTIPFNVLVTSFLKGAGRIKLLTLVTVLERVSLFVAIGFGIWYGILFYLYLLVTLKTLVFFVRLYVMHRYFQFNIFDGIGSLLKLLAVFFLLYFLTSLITLENIYLEAIVNSSLFLAGFLLISYVFRFEGFSQMKRELMVMYDKVLGKRR